MTSSPSNSAQVKTCRICRQTLALSEFPAGRRICRACYRAWQRAYYAKHRERQKAYRQRYGRAYYAKHRFAVLRKAQRARDLRRLARWYVEQQAPFTSNQLMLFFHQVEQTSSRSPNPFYHECLTHPMIGYRVGSLMWCVFKARLDGSDSQLESDSQAVRQMLSIETAPPVQIVARITLRELLRLGER
jgi:hypothetical protein